jgi:TAT-translocated FGD2 family F420-dependent dehydrogenase
MGRRTMLKMSGALVGSAMLPNLSRPGTGGIPDSLPSPQSASAVGRKGTVGFVLSTEQFPLPQLVEYGAAADSAGFDLVWSSDHFHPWQQNEGHSGLAWLSLAAIGQRTKLSFGTGVTCPTYRYRPAIVAEAFASLGLLYPGRVFLGVGTGEALNELPSGGGWGPYQERADRLIEAVTIIRQLWSGQVVNFKGKYYQVQNAKLYDVPTPPVPIFIAASGPKSMRLSGQHGDGLITDSKTALDPTLRAAWAEGAKAANKDSSQMPILAEHFVHVGSDQDPELKQAAELWRFTPKAWTHFVNNPDPVNINAQADTIVPLEEVYNRWTVSEDPQIHAKAIQALFDGGVSQVFIHSGQADQQKVIDFFGKQVLPLVRKQALDVRS